jgi:chromosome segregation ATPase
VLADWLASTGALVGHSRRLRRRLLCLEERAVLAAAPAASDGALSDRTGSALPRPQLPAPTPLSLVLADRLIALDPATARLAAEIQAVLRGAPFAGLQAATIAAAQDDAVSLGSRLAAAEAEVLAQRAEMDLVRENLALQVARANADAARAAELAQAQAARDGELAGAHERLAAAEAAAQAQGAEIDLLRQNLALQVARADADAARAAELAQALAARDGELAASVQAGAAQALALDATRAELTAALARLAVADTAVQAQGAEIVLMRDNLTLQVARADADAARAGRLIEEIAALNTRSAAQTAEIAHLRSQTDRLESDLAGQEMTAQDRKQTIAALEAELERRHGEAHALAEREAASRSAERDARDEIGLLRTNLTLQLQAADLSDANRAQLEVELAALRNLHKAHAQLLAETEALHHRLQVAGLDRSLRDAMVGRALLADQAAIVALRRRLETLAPGAVLR